MAKYGNYRFGQKSSTDNPKGAEEQDTHRASRRVSPTNYMGKEFPKEVWQAPLNRPVKPPTANSGPACARPPVLPTGGQGSVYPPGWTPARQVSRQSDQEETSKSRVGAVSKATSLGSQRESNEKERVNKKWGVGSMF